MSGALLDLAAEVVRRARALGADEVRVGVSEGTSTTLARRDRKVEEATAAPTRSLGLSLLVEGRWSTHGTSDLRPEAVARFLANAVLPARPLGPQ